MEEFEGHLIGGYSPGMGHGTSLTINGIDQEDDRDGNLKTKVPKEGDEVYFSIPSGEFAGKIINTIQCHENLNVYVDGVWDGRFGGLEGGRSCYGSFEYTIMPSTKVVSSWGTMPYSQYMLIRHLKNQNPDDVKTAFKIYEKLVKE